MRRNAILALALSWIGGTLLFISCATTPRAVLSPVDIPGANYAGNRACFDCHTNYVRSFAASPHARIHFSDLGASRVDSGCESCHGPGSLHIAASGARQFILNPGRDSAACLKCHLATHSDFKLPYHHPVLENRMNCVQCHDPHGGDIFKTKGGLAMARVNETCAECHQEQSRPFAFEHEAMREGCIVCHQPHGSVNRKLLTESDPNLCLRCHAQVQSTAGDGRIFIGSHDHTGYLNRGTCWSAGCHGAVHGSNVDPRMRF